MGFFAATFAALTMAMQSHFGGAALALPFAAYAIILAAAVAIIRLPGEGIVPDERTRRTIMWSSIGEGVGLFVAANLALNLDRADLILPAMALIVGLHFLPIAIVARFGPFAVLGVALILAAIAGFVVRGPAGGLIAGLAAAAVLAAASVLALRRDWRAKRASRPIA